MTPTEPGRALDVRELAQALCDSSSHLNLMPRAEQRPCAYHMGRASEALLLLHRRAALRAVGHE